MNNSSHHSDDDREEYSEEDGGAALAVGERVVDGDQSERERTAARVVDLPDATAAEFRIDAIDATVAAVNPEHPPDDPVVGVAFEPDLDRHAPGWSAGASEGGGAELDGRLDGGDATVYHYPASRLERVPETWEPAESARERSSGEREREELFGEHPDGVERFEDAARRLFGDPEGEAERLAAALDVGPVAADRIENADAVLADLTTPGESVAPRTASVPPRTRDECAHTRSDRYRPEDDDALVCWECSTRPHNRPEKFDAEDPAGPECGRGSPPAAKLRSVVATNVDASALPDSVREAYVDDPHRLLRNLAALRSRDADRIRRTALRMAYRFHLEDVEAYNYGRALALLRDRGVAAELPIIGDGTAADAGGVRA
jgi:hypothetical protein